MLKIREFQQADIESIRYLQPEEWSDITFFFHFYAKYNFCYPVTAVDKGRIIGVANATVNKSTGWLSHIIVGEDVRGQGIGYKMTERLIDYLHQKKCRTQLLIATKMGDEGTIIAGTKQAGLTLLQFKHIQGKRRTVLPEENQAGWDILKSTGFEYKTKAPRMALGEKIKWKPELIFSRAGGFYG